MRDLCKLKCVPDFSNSVYVSSLFFAPHPLLPLSPTSLPVQTGHVTTTNELHLFSVTDSDIGTYQCTADNGLGTVTASATLSILGNNGHGHTISLHMLQYTSVVEMLTHHHISFPPSPPSFLPPFLPPPSSLPPSLPPRHPYGAVHFPIHISRSWQLFCSQLHCIGPPKYHPPMVPQCNSPPRPQYPRGTDIPLWSPHCVQRSSQPLWRVHMQC